jgi:hypothetical protein
VILSEQARALQGILGASGDLDMIFARELSAKERTQVEDLVLETYNRLVKSDRPLTRERCDFDGGWTSDDRFETIDCDIAEALCQSGDVRPLFHFLVDVDLIAPLEQIWICVNAPLRWILEWDDDDEGYGHYMSPASITFKQIPSEAKRRKIERVFGFDEASEEDDMYRTEGVWDEDDTFSIGTIESYDDYDILPSLFADASKILPVKYVTIGVIVNL